MNAVALTGLRAENALAFLAALGTLSLLEDTQGERPRLAWQQHDRTWIPQVHTASVGSSDDLLQAIIVAHGQRDLEDELGWEKDIMKVTRNQLRTQLQDLLKRRQLDAEPARLLAGCVAELPLRRNSDAVSYTPFRLMPRVGRARFLDTALRESRSGVDHLRSCLFEEWDYVPDTQSMRWDPAALVPARALMAEAPTHAKPRGVPGAVLLAMRGLTSFPLITERHRARPAGMAERNRFIWPIWRDPLRLPAVRMLLSMPWLYELDSLERNGAHSTPDQQSGVGSHRQSQRLPSRAPHDIEAQLRAHGVIATFSAPRVRRGDDDEALGWGIPRFIGDAVRDDDR